MDLIFILSESPYPGGAKYKDAEEAPRGQNIFPKRRGQKEEK